LQEEQGAFSFPDGLLLVLVRPDGHVASAADYAFDEESLSRMI